MSKLLQQADLAPDSDSLRPPHVVQSLVLFSAGYYVAGIVGLLLGFPPSNIGTIWPSTAVLLAALLLVPPRYWWMYLLAAVPTHLHLTANFGLATPLAVTLSQFAGNIVLALLAALAVRSVIGAPPRFDNLRDTIAFVLLGGDLHEVGQPLGNDADRQQIVRLMQRSERWPSS
jgi:integral membrane sensor domain MASE1